MKKGPRLKNQRGAVLILATGMIVTLFAFSALAVDVGYVLLVRNQLQNAADAAALSGANYLYLPDDPGDPGDPQWLEAEAHAINSFSSNRVESHFIVDGVIEMGYWDLSGAYMDVQPTTIKPNSSDLAAVKVMISKSAGNNGGPVNLFFGPIIGISTMDIAAEAIAVVGSPIGVDEGQLFPVAVKKSLYDEYWDAEMNKPKIDPSTGGPYVFQVAQGLGGEWTSFEEKTNNVRSIIAMMEHGNPKPLGIGDNIWVVPSTKTALYKRVPSNINTAIAIVDDVSSNSMQPILGFGAIHIDFAVSRGRGKKKGRYIQAHFIDNLIVDNSPPGGPNFGVYTRSRLAR